MLGLLRPASPLPRRRPTNAAPVRVSGFASFAAVALLTGFAMMTLQSVLIRLGGLTFGSSQFTFSMVVAVFVLCIALGSFAVSALPRIPAVLLPGALWILLLLLGALYAVADTAPYWAHALRNLYRNQSASFYLYQLQAFLGVLLCLALPVALSGAVLPLMFHALRERVTNLGDVAGPALQLEHAGLAARRAARRLRAALLARPPPHLPHRHGGDRVRGPARDTAQRRRSAGVAPAIL